MLNEILKDTEAAMQKSIDALDHAFNRIRTGRASPTLLESVTIDYYGSETPITQLANVSVEDGRTLAISPWERNLVPAIEKGIMKSDLGLNPSTTGDTIRVTMPMLTEETRRDYIKQARNEAETGRVAVRNARRDANNTVKELLKEKEVSEDDARRNEEQIQKLTDKYIAQVDKHLAEKEAELMKV
ncbi:ribosome recycling factor [Salinispirillum marinum]|uniref:Ribosome-recycling factor n=2 Tax=Saccharospirillaceae TaxID=255527 RepID=A0ABV8BJ11_9GAMM